MSWTDGSNPPRQRRGPRPAAVENDAEAPGREDLPFCAVIDSLRFPEAKWNTSQEVQASLLGLIWEYSLAVSVFLDRLDRRPS